jgi:hypothetical protein
MLDRAIILDASEVRTQMCNSNQTTGGLSNSTLAPELKAIQQMPNKITTISFRAGFTNSSTKIKEGEATEIPHKLIHSLT